MPFPIPPHPEEAAQRPSRRSRRRLAAAPHGEGTHDRYAVDRSPSVAQELVDRGLGAGALVDAFDDDGAIEAGGRAAVGIGAARQIARHHHRIGGNAAAEDFAGGAVDDARRRAYEDAHREHRTGLDDDALDDLAARADEAVVLDDDRLGLERLEHAADADAAREVAVLADLSAGPDGRPGIDHGGAVDIGTEIDEARHQNDARRDESGPPDDRARHGAETGRAKARGVPAREFRRHLVPPLRGTGTAGDLAHVVEAEGEQHRLLEPLVDAPGSAVLRGDAQLAAVEGSECRLDGVAHGARGGGIDGVARLPGGVDSRLQLGDVHGDCALGLAERPATCGSPSGVSIDMGRLAIPCATTPARNGVRASATWWTYSASAPSRAQSMVPRSHTVVMPSAAAGARFFAMSSTIAARRGAMAKRRTISA